MSHVGNHLPTWNLVFVSCPMPKLDNVCYQMNHHFKVLTALPESLLPVNTFKEQSTKKH